MAETDSVENILLFISDSTKFESLPATVRELGVTAQAIAPSTFTAPSFPSLITGQYPADHGIWDFNDSLDRKPLLLSGDQDVGFRADTIWTDLEPEQKPPRRMLQIESTKNLDALEPPFVYVEHHKGGHLPYGYSFDECKSTDDFFKHKLGSFEDISSLYQHSVDTAAERFVTLTEFLADADLLESTLLIFVSDHGEVLGEAKYGRPIGHARPMTPELVEVPLTFVGSGLPEGETIERTVSGIDIVPTCFGAREKQQPPDVSGVDLWNETPSPKRRVRSDVWQTTTIDKIDHKFTKYKASSVWDSEGGRVYHQGPTYERLGYAMYVQLYAGHGTSFTRPQFGVRSASGLLKTYLPKHVEYGSPGFTVEQGKTELPEQYNRERERCGTDQIPQEQLEKLGYLE
ncbi:sulfatase-like hydrolase/transferase [Halostella sp. PRR32]|uniref:sulfatase-like hydrolase/transferase n=1 Tax=Halostella sp. PRR32 TaxID=3098147 RepID=UPI002B1D945E|nr:sulfatase-like hydrolase/transferase [Halostella sp. PRR32]